jgi:hypothetical protein
MGALRCHDGGWRRDRTAHRRVTFTDRTCPTGSISPHAPVAMKGSWDATGSDRDRRRGRARDHAVADRWACCPYQRAARAPPGSGQSLRTTIGIRRPDAG